MRGRLNDPDDQTVEYRFFIDSNYANPLPNVTGSIGSPIPGGRRSFDLDLRALCTGALGTHTLEMVVSDTGFLGNAGRAPRPGGGTDSVVWRYECEKIPVVPDGGS